MQSEQSTNHTPQQELIDTLTPLGRSVHLVLIGAGQNYCRYKAAKEEATKGLQSKMFSKAANMFSQAARAKNAVEMNERKLARQVSAINSLTLSATNTATSFSTSTNIRPTSRVN